MSGGTKIADLGKTFLIMVLMVLSYTQTRILLATFVICSAASVTILGKLSLLYVYLGFLKNSQHFYTIKDLNIFDFWVTF